MTVGTFFTSCESLKNTNKRRGAGIGAVSGAIMEVS
jgi:hypothetical protein